MILHCGDICSPSVLDKLNALCPVIAVPGESDRRVDPRLYDFTKVVNADGVRIGLVHDINWPGPHLMGADEVLTFPPEPLAGILIRKFGQPVDVVAFGDTHNALIATHEDVLFVNPGYAICRESEGQTVDLGNIAIVSTHHGKASAEIVQITRKHHGG